MIIAKGGKPWIITSLLITVLFFILYYYQSGIAKYIFMIIFVLLLLISFVLVIFFRDPKRKTGQDIIAVADGIIREIGEINDSEVGKCIKISTFMNIHNVHVNRMPLDAKILEINHIKGAHIPAFKKESEKNERVIILLESKVGKIKIIQIAGTLARRIVPYIKAGDTVKKGDKIGLIRLGSRVDIYLPTNKIKKITVNLKDKIKAGEDTIAKIND